MRAPACFVPPAFHPDGPPTNVQRTNATIGDLRGVFADEEARQAFPEQAVVYAVHAIRPVPEGTEGGLFCGTTLVMPGQVGGEYFMTRGHFHTQRDRAEFYWCMAGEGLLLLMDEDRRCRAEPMWPGTTHYIPGHTAHRAVNTGHEVLSFSACWPSDAGHDYAAIVRSPFSLRVFCVDSVPTIVEARG